MSFVSVRETEVEGLYISDYTNNLYVLEDGRLKRITFDKFEKQEEIRNEMAHVDHVSKREV